MRVPREAGDGVAAAGVPAACVVEDDPLLCDTLVEVLAGVGFAVVGKASTLAEGRRIVMAEQPDVAIIDNALPDGRGIDLCVALQRAGLGIAVILYSGLLSAEEEATAAAAGVVVVMKSIRMVELRAALDRIVRPGPGGASGA